MCGIAGVLSSGRIDPLVMRRMVATLRHRGPDDEGIWIDAGIGLGHRRLSVIDLSPNGHQPMVSQSGRYVLTFNGEIYNHAALRAALESEGINGWRGHSTPGETLLEVIASGPAGAHAAAPRTSWAIDRMVSRLSVGLDGR